MRRERAEAIGAPWRADRSDWRARQPSLVSLKGPIVEAGVQSWAALTDGVQVWQGKVPPRRVQTDRGAARARVLLTRGRSLTRGRAPQGWLGSNMNLARFWARQDQRQAELGLGRILALYCRSSTSYQAH